MGLWAAAQAASCWARRCAITMPCSRLPAAASCPGALAASRPGALAAVPKPCRVSGPHAVPEAGKGSCQAGQSSCTGTTLGINFDCTMQTTMQTTQPCQAEGFRDFRREMADGGETFTRMGRSSRPERCKRLCGAAACASARPPPRQVRQQCGRSRWGSRSRGGSRPGRQGLPPQPVAVAVTLPHCRCALPRCHGGVCARGTRVGRSGRQQRGGSSGRAQGGREVQPRRNAETPPLCCRRSVLRVNRTRSCRRRRQTARRGAQSVKGLVGRAGDCSPAGRLERLRRELAGSCRGGGGGGGPGRRRKAGFTGQAGGGGVQAGRAQVLRDELQQLRRLVGDGGGCGGGGPLQSLRWRSCFSCAHVILTS